MYEPCFPIECGRNLPKRTAAILFNTRVSDPILFSKVNVIERLELEFASFKTAVLLFSYYATATDHHKLFVLDKNTWNHNNVQNYWH